MGKQVRRSLGTNQAAVLKGVQERLQANQFAYFDVVVAAHDSDPKHVAELLRDISNRNLTSIQALGLLLVEKVNEALDVVDGIAPERLPRQRGLQHGE
jgi:hypothetical protein